MLKKYNNCTYCGSKKLVKVSEKAFLDNFYLKAIRFDLGISLKYLKTLKVYRCKICHIIQNNPWFTEEISRKIYSNIYGQHNRNWTNALNFFKKGELPNHGNLFDLIYRNIQIKNYAEFNSPFMGLLLNFFKIEHKNDIKFYNKFLDTSLKYLSSRQMAGFSKKKIKLNEIKSKKLLNEFRNLKKKNSLRKKIKKSLLIDNSSLSWGQNDNYKSVNSKSLASELFDLDIVDINKIENKTKFDLFGIFHTLDHTFEPKKILDLALKSSQYVIIYCHVDKRLEKQHLFSLTEEFLNFLNDKKIYTLNLSKKINKKFKVPELYFLCSRHKKNIETFKFD